MHEPAVTAADLTRRIAERSARVGIIGQGYVGLPLAMEFARVGFAVTGFDTSLDRVTTLNAGRSHTPDVPAAALRARLDAGRYQATTDLSGLSGCDAVIICVTPTSCTQTSRDCATDGRRIDVQVSRRSHPETWLTSLPKWQKLGFRRKLPVPPHFKSHAMDRNC